ncbi:MAG: FAD binding domain-containing protein [Alphaproteobacteria bacterium]|nr:FAD binding domain-containing protein [Alphaproteobacteria bacterium]
MKPAPFKLVAPRSREEALAALAEHDGDARVLAGGQSLVPLMNMRVVQPGVLVSINGCRDLDYIRLEDDRIVCGALARQAAAEESDLVRRRCPLLADAAPWIGGMANRNRGTVCGSLAHSDPLAELPAVAVATDAEIVLASRDGRRTLAATDFFVGELATAIRPGEMVEAARFATAWSGERTAFLEVSNRQHAFAVAGVAVRLDLAPDGRCRDVRIAVMGGGPTAMRIEAGERAVVGTTIGVEAARAAADAVERAVDPPTDIHADAAYRRRVLGVLTMRALQQAAGRS